MAEDLHDYWVASAAALPVIALAIMAEARETVKYWRAHPDALPGFLKITTATLWFVYIFLGTLSMSQGLKVLSGGHASPTWVSLNKIVIVQGMGTIAVTPMITLLGQSRAVVKAVSYLLYPFVWMQAAVRRSKLSRIEDSLGRRRREAVGASLSASVLLSRVDRIISLDNRGELRLEESERAEIEQYRTELVEVQEDIRERLEGIRSVDTRATEAASYISAMRKPSEQIQRALEALGNEAW